EIYHQLKVRWCLYRQVGRLFALENSIYVSRRAPELVSPIPSIRNETAGVDKQTVRKDCRQPMPVCQLNDEIAVNAGQRTTQNNQYTIRFLCEHPDGALDLLGITHCHRGKLDSKQS